MKWDPVKLATKPVRWTSALLTPVMMLYLIATLIIFFAAVIPSYQNDTTSWTFAVDSTVYVYMADALRSGHPEPWVLGAFASFPNTVMTPVVLAYVLNSPFWEMIFNFVVFGISIAILNRTFSVSPILLTALLLLNATTTTSLLCVNKEIIDLLCLALFLYGLRMGRTKALLLALVIALVNRFEFCLVMLAFLGLRSRWNPLRQRRLATVMGVVFGLNFFMPVLARHMLLERFQGSQYAGFIKSMDLLQLNYLYFVAVIPKIAENIFGQLVNPAVWQHPEHASWLYINFANNLSYLILIAVVFLRRRFRLRNDLMYFAILGSIIIAQSLVVQPRYFYFIYVLLCLEAAGADSGGSSLSRLSPRFPGDGGSGEGREATAIGAGGEKLSGGATI